MYFQWYRYCFSKYFTFQGRASRTEYWSFTIINLLILWVFWFLSKLVDIPEEAMSEGIPVFPKDPVLALIFGSLYLIFCITISSRPSRLRYDVCMTGTTAGFGSLLS